MMMKINPSAGSSRARNITRALVKGNLMGAMLTSNVLRLVRQYKYLMNLGQYSHEKCSTTSS